MCRVANCCFCLDLERGSLIIGIIDIVLGILQLVTQAAKIAYVGLAGAVVELVAGILLVVGKDCTSFWCIRELIYLWR